MTIATPHKGLKDEITKIINSLPELANEPALADMARDSEFLRQLNLAPHQGSTRYFTIAGQLVVPAPIGVPPAAIVGFIEAKDDGVVTVESAHGEGVLRTENRKNLNLFHTPLPGAPGMPCDQQVFDQIKKWIERPLRVQIFSGEASFEGFSLPDWKALYAQALAARTWQSSLSEEGGWADLGFYAVLCVVRALPCKPPAPCVAASARVGVSTRAEYSWNFAATRVLTGEMFLLQVVGGTSAEPANLLQSVTVKFTSNMSLSVMPWDLPETVSVSLNQTATGTEGTITIGGASGAFCETGVCGGHISFLVDNTSLPAMGILTFEPISGLEFVAPPIDPTRPRAPDFEILCGHNSRFAFLGVFLSTSTGEFIVPPLPIPSLP